MKVETVEGDEAKALAKRAAIDVLIAGEPEAAKRSYRWYGAHGDTNSIGVLVFPDDSMTAYLLTDAPKEIRLASMASLMEEFDGVPIWGS